MDRTTEEILIKLNKVTIIIRLNSNNRSLMQQCNVNRTLDREIAIHEMDSIITMRVNRILIKLSKEMAVLAGGDIHRIV